MHHVFVWLQGVYWQRKADLLPFPPYEIASGSSWRQEETSKAYVLTISLLHKTHHNIITLCIKNADSSLSCRK